MQKDELEKVAAIPGQVLDKTIEIAEVGLESLPKLSENQSIQKAKKYWHILGPGLTTGASDDDPSGIATYSQAGSKYGFQLLWLAGFTFPLMAVVQEMCARIGLVTGRGLAGNIRLHFPRWVLYTCTILLFIANSFNIGADLGAMAQGVRLLAPGANFSLLVVGFSVISAGFQIFISYAHYAKYLKWLALVLFAYVFSALLVGLDWPTVLKHTVVPSLTFSSDQIVLVCAILGTTISPYLFFWQTSQEVEEQILHGNVTVQERQRAVDDQEIKDMRVDVWSGMFLSNVVMFFIIAACGAVLFPNGITEITTSAQAAEALRPFAGDATYYLFTAGVVGTGLLAIPVLAGSSSYALAESFQWRSGLYRPFKQAHAFYGVIILSMLIGLGINFIGLDPIQALIYSAVGNGLVAPVVLVLMLLIASNHRVMGSRVNHRATTWIGWGVIGLMTVAGVAAIVTILN